MENTFNGKSKRDLESNKKLAKKNATIKKLKKELRRKERH